MACNLKLGEGFDCLVGGFIQKLEVLFSSRDPAMSHDLRDSNKVSTSFQLLDYHGLCRSCT